MTQDHYEEKYTDPDLRRRLKAEIMQSDKGGQPGQWSARKSQMLVREYEAQGGGYISDEKDKAARSLEIWAAQDWQTEEGDERARQDGVTKRYLPGAVWERLSESERQEAEQLKEAASQQGIQPVEWTPAVQRAMQEYQQSMQHAVEQPDLSRQELYERAKQLNIPGRSKMNRDQLIAAIHNASAGAR